MRRFHTADYPYLGVQRCERCSRILAHVNGVAIFAFQGTVLEDGGTMISHPYDGLIGPLCLQEPQRYEPDVVDKFSEALDVLETFFKRIKPYDRKFTIMNIVLLFFIFIAYLWFFI